MMTMMMAMREEAVGVAVAKKSLSDLLSRVAHQGASFVIEKRGRPLARLVPVARRKKRSLADVRGWLDDADPFFTAMENITAARHARRPRRSVSPKRRP